MYLKIHRILMANRVITPGQLLAATKSVFSVQVSAQPLAAEAARLIE
jgi:hypothetical protein